MPGGTAEPGRANGGRTLLLAWVNDAAEAGLAARNGADAVGLLRREGERPEAADPVQFRATEATLAGEVVLYVLADRTLGQGRETLVRPDGTAPFAMFRDRMPGPDDLQACRDEGLFGLMVIWTGRLLDGVRLPDVAGLIEAAHAAGLTIGLGGGLETADIPRLLAFGPDVLAFGRNIRAGGRADAPLDRSALRIMRDLLGPEMPQGGGSRQGGSAAMPGTVASQPDRIFVRDFVLPVFIGAYASEYAQPQRVRFSVEAEVAPATEPARDMRDIVSYDLITDAIRHITETGHVEFVETLAERIAERVLAHRRLLSARVMVEKLDLGPGAVGVEIWRKRPHA